MRNYLLGQRQGRELSDSLLEPATFPRVRLESELVVKLRGVVSDQVVVRYAGVLLPGAGTSTLLRRLARLLSSSDGVVRAVYDGASDNKPSSEVLKC